MSILQNNIIGKKIKTVIYSEINHPNGRFYFQGFDTFDHNMNVEMEDGTWWNLSWQNDAYFELGIGLFERNNTLMDEKINAWDATNRWKNVLDSPISKFRVAYIDEAGHIPSKIEIEFQHKKIITIFIAEELNRSGSISYPIQYSFNGEIYVIHDECLLK